MAGAVSGLITFGTQNGPIATGNLDTNFTAFQTAVNSANSYSNYLVDSGSANTIAVTVASPAAATLSAGLTLTIKVAQTNTGATTLNLNGGGAVAVVDPLGAPLASNDLNAGGIFTFVYNGTYWQVLGALASGSTGVAFADTFTATAGQTVFTLSNNPGNINNLGVSLDGSVLVASIDYTWTSPKTLTLTAGAKAGQTLFVRYIENYTIGTPIAAGTNNQIQYNNSGVLNGTTIGGDATLVATTGALTVTKTAGVAFAASATTDTTNAANISSGILPVARQSYTQGGTGSVARTVTNKLQESVSVKDFGAVGDGVTDDSGAFQLAINAAIAAAKTVLIPQPAVSYSWANQVVIQDAQAITLKSTGISGQTDSTKIVWNGANSGTPLYINRTRDSLFSGFSILAGTGTINRAIHSDNASPSGSFITTNNTFRNIHVGASAVGIYVSGTVNNDLHTFDGVILDTSGSYGYYIDNSQAKYIKLIGGIVGQRTTGIYVAQGSFAIWGTNFSLNTTDILLATPTDALSIVGAQSESANKFLDDTGPVGSAQSITITGSRLDTNNVGGDNIYIRYRRRGALNLIGNDFASGVNRPSVRFDTSGTGSGACFNSIGNIYPNNTPFQSATGTAIRVSQNDSYVDGGGSGQPIPYVTDTVPRCIGYIQFNGSTSATISSKNLTLTKNSTGDYTISFTNAPPDALYTVAVTLQQTGVANNITPEVLTYTASSFKVRTINVAGGAVIDSTLVSAIVFR